MDAGTTSRIDAVPAEESVADPAAGAGAATAATVGEVPLSRLRRAAPSLPAAAGELRLRLLEESAP